MGLPDFNSTRLVETQTGSDMLRDIKCERKEGRGERESKKNQYLMEILSVELKRIDESFDSWKKEGKGLSLEWGGFPHTRKSYHSS